MQRPSCNIISGTSKHQLLRYFELGLEADRHGDTDVDWLLENKSTSSGNLDGCVILGFDGGLYMINLYDISDVHIHFIVLLTAAGVFVCF